MTLVVCALLGMEVMPSLLFAFSFFFRIGLLPLLLGTIIGLLLGVLLGVALLRQGGFAVPSAREKGATRGALIGLLIGVVPIVLLSSPPFGMLGFFSLVGLVVGRTFDAAKQRT